MMRGQWWWDAPMAAMVTRIMRVVMILVLTSVISAICVDAKVSSRTSSTSATSSTERIRLPCRTHPDSVPTIPGYDTEATSNDGNPPLTSCWYAGYLNYELNGQQIHTHYTLVTSEDEFDADDDSDNDNQDKPLIYWSNGGPGASSLYGLWTELGPLLLSDLSLETDAYRRSGIPTPLYNPHAWTRLGHILTLDQPAPVGFSYCNTPMDDQAHPHSCGSSNYGAGGGSGSSIAWTDELTAQAAYQAMVQFYIRHPAYLDGDLILTGESYAGIYIPTLAREIVRHNERITAIALDQDDYRPSSTAIIMPLVGFAVGDGCLGINTGICGNINNNETWFSLWDLVFLAGHGQIPVSTFVETMHACHATWPPSAGGFDTNNDMAATAATTTTTNTTDGEYHASINLRAVDDAACQEALDKVTEQAGGVFAYGLYDDCTYSNGFRSSQPSLQGGPNDYPCGGGLVMSEYLNLPVVKKAFRAESNFFSVDNAEGDFDYTPTETDLSGFYKEMNGKLRILVYNGDTDPAINSFAAQNWTSHLGLEETQSWRPWTVDGCRRMGGYVTRYEGNFDFLTIRGAGHMVPTNKAEASFTFMKAWIEGRDYPTYAKDCVSPQVRTHTGNYSPSRTTDVH